MLAYKPVTPVNSSRAAARNICRNHCSQHLKRFVSRLILSGVLAATACFALVASKAFGQGTVNFSLTVSGMLSARVYLPDTNYVFWPTFGNTPSQIPAGTQSYSGAMVSGPYFVAQLWAAAGADQPESALVLASETRTFRAGGAAGLVPGGTAILTNIPVDCPAATVQLRVWETQSSGGESVPTWLAALQQWGIRIGKSPTFNVPGIGGGTNPPPNLLHLRSFSLVQNSMDTGVKPLIYVQPQHATVAPGGTVIFRAESACPAYAPVTWQFNGSNIVSGWANANTATNWFAFPQLANAGGILTLLPSQDVSLGFPMTNVLQLTNVQVAQAGIYSLVVSNNCCNYQGFQPPFAISSNAVLTVGNPGPLSATRDALSQIVLNWDGVFFLQSATNAAGPFTDLPGPVVFGPFTNTDLTGSRFFRLRN